jgi:hypothetical protein
MCPLPLLFILVVDNILSNCEGYGIDIGEPARLEDLDFADDISLLETCKLRLQTFINSVKDAAEQFGLKINTNKTKSMATSGSPLDIKCGDDRIEQVVDFRHLGSTVENTGSNAREVQLRLGQAHGAFNHLKRVWKSQKYSLRLKIRLFQSKVLSVLLYGSETWHLNQQQEKKNTII